MSEVFSVPALIAIKVVFFDIGSTLGDRAPDGTFTPYPTSRQLLATVRDVLGLRVGAITNLPAELSTADIREMLNQAGLLPLLDPKGLITNHDAGAEEPSKAIFQFAAHAMGAPAAQCLYVGEDSKEVKGALAAGMAGLLKPLQPP